MFIKLGGSFINLSNVERIKSSIDKRKIKFYFIGKDSDGAISFNFRTEEDIKDVLEKMNTKTI